jgi:hypothetical protein
VILLIFVQVIVKREPPPDWRHSVCNGDVPDSCGDWEVTNGLLSVPTKVNSSSAHDVSRLPVITSGEHNFKWVKL